MWRVSVYVSYWIFVEEKNHVWTGAAEFADQLATRDGECYLRGHCRPSDWATLEMSGKWRERERCDPMIPSLIEGMKNGFSKSVNLNKIQKVPQIAVDNPAVSGFTEALCKYTNQDPKTPAGIATLNTDYELVCSWHLLRCSFSGPSILFHSTPWARFHT